MKICLSFLLAERCYEELFYLCRWKKVQHVYVCMKDWREKSVFPTDRRFNSFFLNAECCHHSNRQQFRCAKTVCVCWRRSFIAVHNILDFVERLSCQSGTHTHTPSEKKSVVLHVYWLHQLSLTFSVSHTHMTVCFYIKSMHMLQPVCVCVWVLRVCYVENGQLSS